MAPRSYSTPSGIEVLLLLIGSLIWSLPMGALDDNTGRAILPQLRRPLHSLKYQFRCHRHVRNCRYGLSTRRKAQTRPLEGTPTEIWPAPLLSGSEDGNTGSLLTVEGWPSHSSCDVVWLGGPAGFYAVPVAFLPNVERALNR